MEYYSTRIAYAQLNYSIQLKSLSVVPLESNIFEDLYPNKEFKNKSGFGWEVCVQTNYKIGNRVHIGLGIGTGFINLKSSKRTFKNYASTSVEDEVLNWKDFRTTNLFITPTLMVEMNSDGMMYLSTIYYRNCSYTEIDRTSVLINSSNEKTFLIVKEKNRAELDLRNIFYNMNVGYCIKLNDVFSVDLVLSVIAFQINQKEQYLLMPYLGYSYSFIRH